MHYGRTDEWSTHFEIAKPLGTNLECIEPVRLSSDPNLFLSFETSGEVGHHVKFRLSTVQNEESAWNEKRCSAMFHEGFIVMEFANFLNVVAIATWKISELTQRHKLSIKSFHNRLSQTVREIGFSRASFSLDVHCNSLWFSGGIVTVLRNKR